MYKIAHTGIVVGDCQRSLRFYQEVLGGEFIEEYEDNRIKIIFVRLQNGVLELIQHKDSVTEYRQAGPVDHIALAVTDITAEMERLKTLGITCLSEKPKEVLNGKKVIFFSGPDGERLEFMQEN
jgi:lactoylglutathione lyase